MKRADYIRLTFVLMLLAGGAGAAFAGEAPGLDDGVYIAVDGVQMESGDKPLIDNGRVMIPLRAVVEYLGGKINWYPEEQQIVGFRGARGFDLVVGASRASLSDGTVYRLDVPAKIIAGRTYVPLRFVSEAMGCGVEWDETNRTAKIITVPIDTRYEVEELSRPALLRVITDKGGGSGFFYSKEGQILTAADVVLGASWIRVRTAEGKEYQTELMILDGVTGLAKLRLVSAPGEACPVFRYYDDFTGMKENDRIYALGSPLLAKEYVAAGRISALVPGDSREDGLDAYLITAAVTKDNRGGPLVKENGALIGVLCLEEDDGTAFAVPIEYAFTMKNRLANER